MLPTMELDRETFSDFVSDAKKLIPSILEGWTDYNVHDPGITLIELFAWLQEMQQYQINQMSSQSRMKFLKLLGGKRKHREPAKCLVQASHITKMSILPQGTQLYAGDIPFETKAEEVLLAGNITSICAKEKTKEFSLGQEQLKLNKKIEFYPFGREPKEKNEFYIGFHTPLPTEKNIRMYIDVFDTYTVERNEIASTFVRELAEITWQYNTKEGWEQLQLFEDETHHFLRDGSLLFQLEKPMRKEKEQYWIRAILQRNEYEVAPLIERIRMNMLPVLQRNTRAEYMDFSEKAVEQQLVCKLHTALSQKGMQVVYLEEDGFYKKVEQYKREQVECGLQITIPMEDTKEEKRIRIVNYQENFAPQQRLGIGDGFPHQSFELENKNFLYEAFHIMVEEKDGNGRYALWEKVEDFDHSRPEDRHYILEESGLVRFGDCEKGRAPEGEIVLISFADSLGIEGNIKEGKIKALENAGEIEVYNYDYAFAGKNAEELDDCFVRVKRELKEVNRAVTLEDYETIVKRTPGLMIKNCKALPSHAFKLQGSQRDRQGNLIKENRMFVAVEPFSRKKKAVLSHAYIENIQAYLEERALLGTKIKIIPPQYIDIRIFGEIIVKPHYINAKEMIQNCLWDYFKGVENGFGKRIRYSRLYGLVDTLPCVEKVIALVLDAKGSAAVRMTGGDIQLPANGLAYLEAVEPLISYRD